MYIFEDKSTDLLSILFKKAYPDKISSGFNFMGGVGNILLKVQNLMQESSFDETIYIFMDLIPDNFETVKIYSKLRRISLQNEYKLIIFPLVCAEYYFICSIEKYFQYFKVSKDISVCINKLFYKDSSIIETEQDRKFCTSFEKYCKLILLKDSVVLDCIRHLRGQFQENNKYGRFYKEDCICDESDLACVDGRSLQSKALSYLEKYPCYPKGSFFIHEHVMTEEEIWAKHNSLVNTYNEWCNRLKSQDSKDNSWKYRTINPIK